MTNSSLINTANAVIPQPNGVTKVINTDFDTMDIVELILYADTANKNQAEKEMSQLAPYLVGKTDLDTLKNIWSFVRDNVKYVGDPVIHEDVKLPSEVWHSGFADCKSKSIMVASLLKAYPQFGIRYRFASYDQPGEYTHVYVIAETKNGPVIIDSVYHKFNAEEKYKYHKDFMSRELRFIHGPGRVGAAVPTLQEAFDDGPKKVFTPPIIDVAPITQGELLIELLDQKYQILSAYYGDINKRYSTARKLLSDIKKSRLENANLNISLPDEFRFLINKINIAKAKHVNELRTIASFANPSAVISGWQEEAQDCINKFRPEEATYAWKNNPFKKRYVNIDYTQLINGVNYKIESDEFRVCYDNVRKRSFASLKFFNSDNWIKGSHHILYKFLSSTEADQYGATTATKGVFHKLTVGGLSNLSAFDEVVVTQYLENAILQNSAKIKLPDVTPQGSIEVLKEAAKPKIGEPITIAAITALITALGGAVASVAALLGSLDHNQKLALESGINGIGTPGFGPQEQDFALLSKSADNGLIIGGVLAAAAAGLLIYKNK